MKIIGYTYDALYHCTVCTKAAHPYDATGHADIHFVPSYSKESDGNFVRPVFDIDDEPAGGAVCSDCNALLS